MDMNLYKEIFHIIGMQTTGASWPPSHQPDKNTELQRVFVVLPLATFTANAASTHMLSPLSACATDTLSSQGG